MAANAFSWQVQIILVDMAHFLEVIAYVKS